MTDIPDDTSEALKRIKQLENQNIKFKYLLEAILQLSSQDAKGITDLQNESDTLRAKVELLENEKTHLEEELSAVLEDNGGEMSHAIRKLEQENTELKARFENVVKEIKKENLDLDKLKTEDVELKKILVELENEKAKLIEKIQSVGGSSSDTTNENAGTNLEKKLFEIESERFNMMSNLDENSSDDILPTVRSLDETYKNYVQAFEEQTNIKGKISELEHKNEDLLKVVEETESTDLKSQFQVNEEIIISNTNFLNEVEKVKSKMQEYNQDFVNSLEAANDLATDKILELETTKTALYKELEQCLINSSKHIKKLARSISDPQIKRIVNEIEIQKTVLLYSLQSVKLNPYRPNHDHNEIYLPSVPNSLSKTNIDFSKISSLNFSQPSENPSVSSKDNKILGLTTSKDDHQKLEEEVNRLEYERARLLEQLRSISTTSATRINEIVTQNERQLQTQSELHSTFMRESSHEVIITQNYDDATNQLYANEDARLEQRIRELEMENIRIQRELDNILEEIRADKNEMSRLQFTGQTLKERIEELENNTSEKKD